MRGDRLDVANVQASVVVDIQGCINDWPTHGACLAEVGPGQSDDCRIVLIHHPIVREIERTGRRP